jgi:hypothetical protein
MSTIFLSVSVPVEGQGDYYQTGDPLLIQFAVRQLLTAIIHDQQIVWGGHPAITPMIVTICEDLQIDYSKSLILYQSRFFEETVLQKNTHFNNIIWIDAVAGDRDMSLSHMREAMLSREDLKAAVFIGGMEGVELEYEMFRRFHPDGIVLPVPATGGAARYLAIKHGCNDAMLDDVDFARMFRTLS